jgi:hypothetical protein
MPYIVHVERGTMNRGIYDIAVLFDPAEPWTALAPQAEWNGKVVYTFGVHRPAAPAVSHRAELGRRQGAVTRLHGGGQQPHGRSTTPTARSSPRRRR